ncbi:Holliday junction resolvase RuvX [Spiroplasma endosymbiont of Monopis laevigella]|uniref:Holliday junction resolvase RuvX n=1 Tax=Spiroplasma endosymbiont of Monopis laevigella TaxID=3066312 RepID=UPI0030D33994
MKYLGIDLGSKTLGLARGEGKIAFSWKNIRFPEHDFNNAIIQLQNVIKEYDADILVFGYPLNMDSTVGPSAKIVLNFIDKFKLTQNNDKLNIVLQDERRTTYSSQQILIKSNVSSNKRKQVKDQLAAAIILQSYFDKITQS